MKLTKAQRAALEAMPVYPGHEASERRLKADGVGMSTLWSLDAADLVAVSRYANGRFWSITDLGRSILSSEGEGERQP